MSLDRCLKCGNYILQSIKHKCRPYGIQYSGDGKTFQAEVVQAESVSDAIDILSLALLKRSKHQQNRSLEFGDRLTFVMIVRGKKYRVITSIRHVTDKWREQ